MKNKEKTEMFNKISRGASRQLVPFLFEADAATLQESLCFAAKKGNYLAIPMIAAHMRNKDVPITCEDQNGFSAGYLAFFNQHLSAFDALIAAGFDANTPDGTGASIADHIARTRSTPFAEILRKNKTDMTLPNRDGDTPFIVALKNAAPGVATQYLHAGAPVTPEALRLAEKYPHKPLIAEIKARLSGKASVQTRTP